MTEDAYRFFFEIALRNERAFFEENRARYEREVKKPMYLLAAALGDVAADINPALNTRPSAVVSRIRRDTRFTRDKSLYRDHAWLSYKEPGRRTGESFVLYAEFERDGYGYGMGMYCPQPEYMADIRRRILARPALFLKLVQEPGFAGTFTLNGEDYKRPKHPDAPQELQPWLNKRKFSYSFFSPDLKRTMDAGLVDEIRRAFVLMKPVYRFIQGID